jgi:hypothetical protein
LSPEHFKYNSAVKEHLDRFKQTHNVTSEEMTPDHALTLVGEIKKSKDPRIRNFNMQIMMREVMYLLRRRGRRID